jgi:hypothetical protein
LIRPLLNGLLLWTRLGGSRKAALSTRNVGGSRPRRHHLAFWMNANLWRRLRKVVFAFLILALVALTGGMTYETIGGISDARRFPVRGRMVLTAGQAADNGNRDLDAFRKAWLGELQPSLVNLSRRGRQVVVQDSDHKIPYKDPEAIVRAIQSVWA